jgi:hypothetical protein
MKIDLVNIEYLVEHDAFEIVLGIIDDKDTIVAELVNYVYYDDLKAMDNFDLMKPVFEKIKKEAMERTA